MPHFCTLFLLQGEGMPANTFGELFRVTTFGESHGAGLGGIIDGCPPGLPLCEAEMKKK